MKVSDIELIRPNWPAPGNVRTVISTRKGGASRGPYAGANFGLHVEDDPGYVHANREQLKRQTGIDNWQWLEQVHGTDVCTCYHGTRNKAPKADAAFTSAEKLACTIMTADCLPVLFCDEHGREVAAAHAGWRGLAEGVLASTINCFASPPESLMAYLGPAISQKHFEVGSEVKTVFIEKFGAAAASCFRCSDSNKNKFHADLYELARLTLRQRGVQRIYGGDFCTYDDSTRFYSYRRDLVTGRMVSAIWIAS